jgi:hypothetical protein
MDPYGDEFLGRGNPLGDGTIGYVNGSEPLNARGADMSEEVVVVVRCRAVVY